jgi:hypothetical protein
LIPHGEFRAVAGGGVDHVYKTLPKTMFLAESTRGALRGATWISGVPVEMEAFR